MLKNVPAEEIVLYVTRDDGFPRLQLLEQKITGIQFFEAAETKDLSFPLGITWSLGLTINGRLWVHRHKGAEWEELHLFDSFAAAQRSELIPNDILNMARRTKRRMVS